MKLSTLVSVAACLVLAALAQPARGQQIVVDQATQKVIGLRGLKIHVGSNRRTWDVDFVDGTCVEVVNNCDLFGVNLFEPPWQGAIPALRNTLVEYLDSPNLIQGCESSTECDIRTPTQTNCCGSSISGYGLIIRAGDTDPGYSTSSLQHDRYVDLGSVSRATYAVWRISVPDVDGDGIADAADNCVVVANAEQLDADGDGYGNRCDADLNNDCVTNVVDLGQLRSVFFTSDSSADLNSDGVVNVIDLGILRQYFFGPPGPSALTQDCSS